MLLINLSTGLRGSKSPTFNVFFLLTKCWCLHCETYRDERICCSKDFHVKASSAGCLLIRRWHARSSDANENESTVAYFRQGNDLEMKFTRLRGWIVIEKARETQMLQLNLLQKCIRMEVTSMNFDLSSSKHFHPFEISTQVSRHVYFNYAYKMSIDYSSSYDWTLVAI